MGGGCGGRGPHARVRATTGFVVARGGRLRARLVARWGCGGASCVPIAGAGGVRCGRPGLVRLAAVGRAPRLRRAGGGGVTAGRVRFPVRRRAALVGGGIAAAPKVHTGGTRHGKHAPPARPVRTLAVRALRVFALCASAAHACVPVLCARCTCAVCRRHVRARAHACCACPCGVCSSCAPSCWACGALVQRSPRSCDVRSSTSSTSRGCTGPCFVLALCMLALSYLCPPCSRCVYLLCMRWVCTLAVCALALPMLALRAPVVPALAVRACAVRFRAVCGVLVQRPYTSCGARRHCIPVDPGDLP